MLEILPSELLKSFGALPETERRSAEEIRLRIGCVPTVLLPIGEKELPGTVVTSDTLRTLLERATDASPYAFLQSMARGYLSCRGGVRIGLCGEMSEEGDKLVGRTLTSAAIRLPHEVLGCGEAFVREGFRSTLILSSPGLGKTTLLRDMIRALSEQGMRVGVADERGEIAGFSDEGFSFQIGRRTDVITHASKHRAAMMLLRTMSIQVLAMDEITEDEDREAVLAAANSGVFLLASAHTSSSAELRRKPWYRQLSERKVFERVIVISEKDGARVYSCEEIA